MKVAVVGSGPAGVAAASALVRQGVHVDLLDFGNEIESESHDLARSLRENGLTPESREKLRPPPNLDGILSVLRRRAPFLDPLRKTRLASSFSTRDIDWGVPVDGDGPIARSLARGGLSNIWGATCYSLAERDYEGWPIGEPDLKEHYGEVARLLSLIQTRDSLEAAYPLYGPEVNGPPMNPPAQALFDHWRKNESRLLNNEVRFGRSRLAVRMDDDSEGSGCKLCGLCLYGCPYDSIYRSDWTLSRLQRDSYFRYVRPFWVGTFEEKGSKVFLRGRRGQNGAWESLPYDAVFLAAGTVSTLRIAADSMKAYDHVFPMQDNDLYVAPFLSLVRQPRKFPPPAFTLNELALRATVWGYPLHLQLYVISDRILNSNRWIFSAVPGARRLLSRLFVSFIYMPGKISAGIQASVKKGDPVSTVSVTQTRRHESTKILRQLLFHMAKNWRAFGLLPAGPGIPSGPAGPAGSHLVGALPMQSTPGPMQTDAQGKLFGTGRVYVVDGAALPTLPAQNCTYTIMANAHRIGAGFGKRTGGNSTRVRGNRNFNFGRENIRQGVSEFDHHGGQYTGSWLTRAYHRHVLKKAAGLARLQPGMEVLDYGCGGQELRRVLPTGVRYTGYDLVPRFSDLSVPQSRTYQRIFAIQVLMYLNETGLRSWAETFSKVTSEVVVAVPARNWLKDEVLDRWLGQAEDRERMVQSLPQDIYRVLSEYFKPDGRWDLYPFAEFTRWKTKS